MNNSERQKAGKEFDQAAEQARAAVKTVPPEEEDRDPNTPTNAQRAEWANAALRAYAQETGFDILESNLQDLINNLAHWCDRHGLDLRDAWESALPHYDTETNGQGNQFHAAKFR